ncbi:ABC transporter substrate-binding protein [Kytococcus sedentarius]|uniref:ABC-type oligopeptide transport system, periplasmic component n=1 Tax=Kytococcus sedentarius (strain ATCC 14392 / DSM 20547 / JCM 11482 / CCUG 33030 / NBRC 15357 / NCTC 11040 / CCM 314 / 541) TaxID=478801 RepID=C7NHD6_KYTSD|nr:ABC transporter substrate-binding protein [Kytococcus sedentarius]ACV06293.1 ABC-type oligopeptide transport system, periplasmic component [Kytococcus sedentarius DSM 20547]QQB64627.1 ABC transporter substrate-binding protein [Kytococcus sedentarius]STX12288.1 Stage 0 sporulation protein KA [Kytococcus sedentarius]
MAIKRNKWLASAAGVAALSLTLTACGGDDESGGDESSSSQTSAEESGSGSGDESSESGSDESSSGGDDAAAGGGNDEIITANGSEPQNPLIPANTTETGGGKILDMVFAKLIDYDSEGQSVMDVAESIESEDNKVWTIKIKDDRKFSDGTPVTAQSFVDAWNWGAHIDNNNQAAYFFEPIQGYAEVHPASEEGSEEAPAAEAEEMSGLKVVDDTTFEVTLEEAYAAFPQRLGYTAFAPLPESFFEDPEAFGEKPVGNGPYMVEEWNHNVGAKLVKNPNYVGDSQPKNGGVDVQFYQEQDAAYVDLQAGKLDVLDAVPETALSTFEDELGDRAVNQPAGVFQSFTFPLYADAPFAGDSEEAKKIRKAISMSIDREGITQKIFQGTRTPAKDFSSPVVDGYEEGICGELCEHDDEKAKALLEEAGGWSGDPLTIAFNSDGGHQAWVDAVCGEITNALGIECSGQAYPNFKGLRDDVGSKNMTGAFRTGWQMDYPALENFLTPLYKTGASSNDGGYSSEEFDKLLDEGDTAESNEESVAKYQEAEKVLVEDAPAIPLWYSNTTGGYSENVQDVNFDVFGVPEYHNIVKN